MDSEPIAESPLYINFALETFDIVRAKKLSAVDYPVSSQVALLHDKTASELVDSTT